jgi:hypothetical protein
MNEVMRDLDEDDDGPDTLRGKGNKRKGKKRQESPRDSNYNTIQQQVKNNYMDEEVKESSENENEFRSLKKKLENRSKTNKQVRNIDDA